MFVVGIGVELVFGPLKYELLELNGGICFQCFQLTYLVSMNQPNRRVRTNFG